ncbi:MAG: diguanylate cyclase [Calditerrivibrio sp.]|nr:diguanylate cyclase [Calditerrivibrio sp.]MCA1932187.1 diguanylate cyclase [Calditerrivibrio sp.]
MKKYILIADPSKVSRFVLEQYLSDKYNILVSTSIAESKRMLSMAVPSIVLVAYELRDGLGYELCRYVNEKLKNVPVVIISSEESPERKRMALESGAIDYIVRKKIDESIVNYIDEIVELLDISNLRGSNAIIVQKDSLITKFTSNVLFSLGMQVYPFNEENLSDEQLVATKPDIIIIDLDIGNENALTLIKNIRKVGSIKKVPILILTDSRENKMLRSFMLFGANDYTLKPLTTESLLLRVTTNIRTKKLYDYLERVNSELYTLATTDPLTGLYNRRYIIEQLTIMNYNFERYGNNFSIIIMDLDKFKTINDTYGHDAGDKVIIDFASKLKDSVRKTDFVGRFGGEEVIIILQNITEQNLINITQKILTEIRSSNFNYNNFTIKYTASMGVKYCSTYSSSVDDYIKSADYLLYMSKEKGRDRAHVETTSGIIEIV